MKIFHIVERKFWNEQKRGESYSPISLKEQGFIHCSRADQILEVANHLYKGNRNLIILRIDQSKVKAEVVNEKPFETPHSIKDFPHIYGALNFGAIEKEIDFPCNSDGSFSLPDLLS